MDDRLYPLPGASAVPPEVVARLKAAVGPKGFTEDPAALDGHVTAWRDGWKECSGIVCCRASRWPR